MAQYFHAELPNGFLAQFALGEPILFRGSMARFYSAIVHITADRKRFRIMYHKERLAIEPCSKNMDYEILKVAHEGVRTIFHLEDVHHL